MKTLLMAIGYNNLEDDGVILDFIEEDKERECRNTNHKYIDFVEVDYMKEDICIYEEQEYRKGDKFIFE